MYSITCLNTGETNEFQLEHMSRWLRVNGVVSSDGVPVGLITHWDLVFFTRTWAEKLQKGNNPQAQAALRLVDQWLQDPSSVSKEELLTARANAYQAAREAGLGARWAQDIDTAQSAGAAYQVAQCAADIENAWRAANDLARFARDAAAAPYRKQKDYDAATQRAYKEQSLFILDHLQKTSQGSFPFPRA